jgi:hypothetical protein
MSKFNVHVSRTLYQNISIEVEAEDEDAAEALALEQAEKERDSEWSAGEVLGVVLVGRPRRWKMSKFKVIVTRDVTESAFLYFEAESKEQAHELALGRAEEMPATGWMRDDCSGGSPYITGCDEEDDDA